MRRTMLPRIMLTLLTVCALGFVSLTLEWRKLLRRRAARKTLSTGSIRIPDPEFVKYAADRDTNSRRIDLFIGDWQGSMPRFEHGSLVLRDILTHGDNFAPSEKGAVLHAANFFAYGRLAPGAWTTPSKLDGHQEVYYILGGQGEITAGGDTARLQKNVAVLMPAGLEFVMKSTGTEALTMYVINEPTPSGFHPKDKMLVKDEAMARQRTPADADPYIVGGASGHWAHIVKELFSPADGLATEQSVITVTVNPSDDGRTASSPSGSGRSLGCDRRHQPDTAGNGTSHPATGHGLYAAAGFSHDSFQHQCERQAGKISVLRPIPRRRQLHPCNNSCAQVE